MIVCRGPLDCPENLLDFDGLAAIAADVFAKSLHRESVAQRTPETQRKMFNLLFFGWRTIIPP
jgi:hypothetical protein